MENQLQDTLATMTFGIELEFVCISRQQAAQAIHTVVGGVITGFYGGTNVRAADGRLWRAVSDSSLQSPDGRSAEVVSPILTVDDIPMLQEIVRSLRRAGARANATCGIHVHLGVQSFTPKAICNLVKIVHKHEEHIAQALQIDPRRRHRYCKNINPAFLARVEARRPTTMRDLNTAWYGHFTPHPHRYDDSRYHGLNLNNAWTRNTIEFRLFNGTIHAGKVKTYIQLAMAIGAKAINARTASSKRRPWRAESAKYDVRTLLISLGLNGPEYKTARYHLLKHLRGNSAWKNGRPDAAANDDAPSRQAAA